MKEDTTIPNKWGWCKYSLFSEPDWVGFLHTLQTQSRSNAGPEPSQRPCTALGLSEEERPNSVAAPSPCSSLSIQSSHPTISPLLVTFDSFKSLCVVLT